MLYSSKLSWLKDVLVLTGVLAVAGVAGEARGEVIFSNYGPGMTYNTDWHPAAYDGGGLRTYNGPLSRDGRDYDNVNVAGSFTTPAGADWFPTSVTLALRTMPKSQLFIVEDDGGVPLYRFSYTDNRDYGYGDASTGPTIDGNTTVSLTPGEEEVGEFAHLEPRPMKGGTKYWLLLHQLNQNPIVSPLDPSENAYTIWYRSSNDPDAPANSVYLRDQYNGSVSGGYLPGPRPVFQIEATAVPEPTTAAVALPLLAAALLRRRARRS